MDTFDCQKQIVDAICEGGSPKTSCGSFFESQEAYDDYFDDRRKEHLESTAE